LDDFIIIFDDVLWYWKEEEPGKETDGLLITRVMV
jgi:hypothetical protein